MIAAFWAQGLDAERAASLALSLHMSCANHLLEQRVMPLRATNLIEILPQVFFKLLVSI